MRKKLVIRAAMPIKQVAKAMGLSPTTVMKLEKRALKKMREHPAIKRLGINFLLLDPEEVN